jgi:hypothetical protein
MQTTKASGCNKTPAHIKETKIEQDRCPKAPAGGQCADAKEVTGSSLVVIESNQVPYLKC